MNPDRIDHVITVYLNDGEEIDYVNHESVVKEGVLRIVSDDGLEVVLYPLSSVHHTFARTLEQR